MKGNLSVQQYNDAYDSLVKVTTGILHSFANNNLDIKCIVIRNFIGKSLSLLNSIFLLQQESQYGESVILYRVLVERFLFLGYVTDNELFKEFDDWSFIKDFERRNNSRSYPEFNDKQTQIFLKNNKNQIERYDRLKKSGSNWIEPDLESYSKKINLGFLYKLSYDFGSSFVHPRASEGDLDVKRLTGLQSEDVWTYKPILHNAILLLTEINRTGLQSISFFNNSIVSNYCNKILSFLSGEELIPDFDTLTKVSIIGLIKENKTS